MPKLLRNPIAVDVYVKSTKVRFAVHYVSVCVLPALFTVSRTFPTNLAILHARSDTSSPAKVFRSGLDECAEVAGQITHVHPYDRQNLL